VETRTGIALIYLLIRMGNLERFFIELQKNWPMLEINLRRCSKSTPKPVNSVMVHVCG
jgi:hypothetical protein